MFKHNDLNQIRQSSTSTLDQLYTILNFFFVEIIHYY